MLWIIRPDDGCWFNAMSEDIFTLWQIYASICHQDAPKGDSALKYYGNEISTLTLFNTKWRNISIKFFCICFINSMLNDGKTLWLLKDFQGVLPNPPSMTFCLFHSSPFPCCQAQNPLLGQSQVRACTCDYLTISWLLTRQPWSIRHVLKQRQHKMRQCSLNLMGCDSLILTTSLAAENLRSRSASIASHFTGRFSLSPKQW